MLAVANLILSGAGLALATPTLGDGTPKPRMAIPATPKHKLRDKTLSPLLVHLLPPTSPMQRKKAHRLNPKQTTTSVPAVMVGAILVHD